MKRITFFILSILCLTACNNELEKIEQPDAAPQIELILPDAETVNVYSTATVSECRIETLWVIVFNGNTKLWAEKIEVGKITKNGQAAQLLPQLKSNPEGYTVVCIANMDALTLPTDTASLTPTNINSYFRLQAKSSYSGGDALPMYGVMNCTATNYTCVMTRAVAKVQVQMGTSVSDVTKNFTAENVTYKIYNSGSAGQIMPGGTLSGTATTSLRVTGQYNLVQKNGAAENLTHAYIHEYPSATRTGIGSPIGATVANNAFNADRQYIILEKDNNPSPTKSFYRLDFYNNVDSLFLDTKRNNHYMFTINKVRSEGYTDELDARRYPGSNIEYTITINDDFRYITSNGQYAIVSSIDTIKLPSGAQTNLSVGRIRYQANAAMPAINSSTPNTASASAGITLTSPALTGTFASPGTNVDIRVTVLATFVSGTITFKLGNITHTIPVIRE